MLAGESLKVITMNCRGLRDIDKRRDVFNYLRAMRGNIYCLQDTHLKESESDMIRAQWGYTCFLSGQRSDARGTAVLMNNNFEFKVQEFLPSVDGNSIILRLSIGDKNLTLVNLYGPNDDTPEFYRTMLNQILDQTCDHLIICGDWNLVQNFQMDCRNYKRQNNPKASREVEELKEVLNLSDAWRSHNPDARRYTWFRKTPPQRARLDFFLISEHLLSFYENSDILPGYRTDHAITTLTLKLTSFLRGRGYWKFNDSLLKNKEYVDEVKKCIANVRREYALPVYSLDAMANLDPDCIQFTINDQLLFEMFLLKIREMTISWGAKLKRDREKRHKTLEEQLKTLMVRFDQSDNDLQLGEEIEQCKQELETIRKEYMQGVLVRTRAKWIEEGEKPTKYFCSLEKRNFLNKTISKLDNQGMITQDQGEILKQVELYYQDLYRDRDSVLDDVEIDSIVHNKSDVK